MEEAAFVWNRNFDFDYRITAPLLERKLFHDRDFFSAGSFFCRDGNKIVAFIASKISDNSVAEYRQVGWISLFVVDHEYRGRGIGTELYRMVEAAFKKAGTAKIIVSGEMHNFFSGIPQPTEESSLFFRKLGFVLNKSVHYDLVNDISGADDFSSQTRINHDADYVTRPAEKADQAKLADFLKAEFPGRWEFEISRCFKVENEFEHVMVLWHKGRVEGFCRIRCGCDTDGIETYLGRDCGALGPIGIAGSIRGKGLGDRILADSLKHLQALGAHKTNIDWTSLTGFYGRFGFTPWREYLLAYKDLK